MLFVFLEDGTVDVVADLAEAQRQYEALDVESDVYRFYDGDGTPLEPVFPDRHERRVLGMRVGEELGNFILRPAGPNADSIEVALEETNVLNGNPWFQSLEQIRAHFSARR
jgi:hypothetical protein